PAKFDAVSGGTYNQSMNLTKCDKCKQPKKEKHSSLDKKSRWINLTIRGGGEWLNFDLCGKCSANLVKYIKRYIGIKEISK
ncbi:MAG: hypothetical protein AAB577_01255, partial [Patescibacteria group bacterium]